MLSNIKRDIERAEREWYRLVFAAWSGVSAAIMIMSCFEGRSSRLIVLPCYGAVFVGALHSYFISVTTEPPLKHLPFRLVVLTVVAAVPWIILSIIN